MKSLRAASERSCLPLATIFGVVALGAGVGCAESTSDGVSYETQLRPIFQRRCILCHYPATELDLIDPFREGTGMFVVKNGRYEQHGGPEYNVVPFEPEQSFLLQKLSDRELVPGSCEPAAQAEPCPNAVSGLFMPPHPPPATDEQIDIVRQWIAEGAEDTDQFRTRVMPFFGKSWRFACEPGGYGAFCVPCITCHYRDAPTTPNLAVPNFEDRNLSPEQQDAAVAEWLQGLVGVKAHYRVDLNLITPGDPDASFLFMKIAAKTASTALGAPMPYTFEPLTDAQVGLVRQWILEGARNN